MAAPKRWFQLTMLQLLVAMPIVALFVAKNMEVKSTSTSQPVFYDAVYAGWPWMYWSAVFNAQAPSPVLQGEYRLWLPLAANVICCLFACVGVNAVVSFAARKTRAIVLG